MCVFTLDQLGWIWNNGSLQASPHKIAAISSVSQPNSVKSLCFFISADNVLSYVLKGYADFLDPLEKCVAGQKSSGKIVLSDDLTHAFEKAQESLMECKKITMPRQDDVLWVVTDGSTKNKGIAATLYANRHNHLVLSVFYVKLRNNQINWLLCEIELSGAPSTTSQIGY